MSLADEGYESGSNNDYVNTPYGTTSMVTPIAKSTPVTQASQMPTIQIILPHVRDILEPSLNEQARAAYLE